MWNHAFWQTTRFGNGPLRSNGKPWLLRPKVSSFHVVFMLSISSTALHFIFTCGESFFQFQSSTTLYFIFIFIKIIFLLFYFNFFFSLLISLFFFVSPLQWPTGHTTSLLPPQSTRSTPLIQNQQKPPDPHLGQDRRSTP